jgi:protein O-mannosyl-transferase
MTKEHKRYLIILVLIALPAAVFWPAQNYQFIGGWDDKENLQENPYLNPVTLPKVFYLWSQPYKGLYIPFTYTVWAGVAQLDQLSNPSRHSVSGQALDAKPFHRLNIVLHLFSGLVVFAILLLLTQNDWAACAGALFFAIHPVQVEPVAWATGAKDLLAGLLSLLAIWQYLHYAVSAKATTGGQQISNPKTYGHYVVALIAFVLALLSKPSAVAVPLILWVIDYWILCRSPRQSLLALAPFLIMATPFVVINKLAQPDEVADYVSPVWARPLIAADAIVYYLYKIIYPAWLTPDYGRPVEKILRQGAVYLTSFVSLVLGISIWLLRAKMPWLVAAALGFVAALLPVSGLVPFDFQYISTGADRYLYLAMFSAALAIAYGLKQIKAPRAGSATVGCAVILCVLAVRSHFQLEHWRDPLSLFTHIIEGNPNSWSAYNNLGNLDAAQGNWDEAMRHFDAALRANPRNAKTYNNIGNVAYEKGDFDRAIDFYHRALDLDPRIPSAHSNLGLALIKLGKTQEAIDHYRRAVKSEPDYADAYDNLGTALMRAGRVDEAIGNYRQAVAIKPGFAAAHYNLAFALGQRGDFQSAETHYRSALAIEPRLVEAHSNLSLVLLKRGDTQGAIDHAREAVKLAPETIVNHLNLGNILLSQKQADEAIVQFKEALRLDPDVAEAHEGLGHAFESQGKMREAVAHYQRTVELMKRRSLPKAERAVKD